MIFTPESSAPLSNTTFLIAHNLPIANPISSVCRRSCSSKPTQIRTARARRQPLHRPAPWLASQRLNELDRLPARREAAHLYRRLFSSLQTGHSRLRTRLRDGIIDLFNCEPDVRLALQAPKEALPTAFWPRAFQHELSIGRLPEVNPGPGLHTDVLEELLPQRDLPSRCHGECSHLQPPGSIGIQLCIIRRRKPGPLFRIGFPAQSSRIHRGQCLGS